MGLDYLPLEQNILRDLVDPGSHIGIAVNRG